MIDLQRLEPRQLPEQGLPLLTRNPADYLGLETLIDAIEV